MKYFILFSVVVLGIRLENSTMLLYDALANIFAEMKTEVDLECPTLSAQQVADAFVLQYYHILRVSPDNLHKFYKDCSIMAHPGSEGTMVSVTTMQVCSWESFKVVTKYLFQHLHTIVDNSGPNSPLVLNLHDRFGAPFMHSNLWTCLYCLTLIVFLLI